MSKELQIMIKAAKAGGKIVKNYFGKELLVTEKSTVYDYQTKADVESEQAIIKILTKNFPTYNILAEESGLIDNQSDFTFIVDPLDGSNNFVLGVPYFTVVIALQHRQTTIAGVIFHPMTHDCFYAGLGRGAYKNGQRLKVSGVKSVKRSTISYMGNYSVPRAKSGIRHSLIYRIGIKRLLAHWAPAADFCLLASGRTEGIFHEGTEVYDYLAGKLLAKEAGAKITDYQGRPEKSDANAYFVASNGGVIHKKLVSIAKKLL